MKTTELAYLNNLPNQPTNTSMTTNIYTLAALSAAVKRPQVDFAPGEIEIDATIRIKGTLKAGEPTSRNVAPDWQSIALQALAQLDDDTIEEILVNAEQKRAPKEPAIVANMEQSKKVIKARVAKNNPVTTVKGRLGFYGTVEFN